MILGRAGKKPEWQMVDVHCHVLPGLDDGARDMSETASMLRLAVSEGISDMVVTPHFHSGKFMAPPEKILERLAQVREMADREKIPVRLHPGNEVYYFDDMASWLGRRRLCTMNDTRYVLVEFAPSAMFRTIQNAADGLMNEGYLPILAHAERYACLMKNVNDAVFLHDMGVRLQVNASTVTGKNGTEGKRFAHRLLKWNAVDLVGTDAHGSVHRTPEIARCREFLVRKCGGSYAYRLLCGNAREMFGLE